MRRQRKEDAVSPVVGVMLMLVVTIVIAAVITSFATDLSADTGSTPMALFDIDYVDTESLTGGSKMYVSGWGIEHKGGDAVPLKDIQITYVTDGGMNNGLLFVLDSSKLSVEGKESEGDSTMITTGDVISMGVDRSSSMSWIPEGSTVTWTISHTKSGGVIAKGEFIALPM